MNNLDQIRAKFKDKTVLGIFVSDLETEKDFSILNVLVYKENGEFQYRNIVNINTEPVTLVEGYFNELVEYSERTFK